MLVVAAVAIPAVSSLPQLLAPFGPSPASGEEAQTVEPSAVSERFGIDFISSIDVLKANYASLSQRYSLASQAGANWNRWPFYWPDIESQDGDFNFVYHDFLVNSDLAQGIRVNAVLMNSPGWAAMTSLALSEPQGVYGPTPRLGQKSPPLSQTLGLYEPTAASPATYAPRNLYTPIFADGSDVPGAGKEINSQNYWADFVYRTVDHFRGRVSHWEMWNEPDVKPTAANGWFGFWSGTVQDYARLLKVGYLAAKHADSSATVLMGGMSYWANPAFFGQVLDEIKKDPAAGGNNYYFDVSVWHWYSRSSQMYDMVLQMRNTLAAKGMAGKPIWVNETGIPVWNDPVSPRTEYPGSGTMDEQASYVIQALAYGLAAGVDKSFFFQELDDGNGEVFGLIRNDFSLRPAYTALRVASQYFETYASVSKASSGNVERIVFWGTPKGKVTVLWNKSPNDLVHLAAPTPGATRAYLVDKAGNISDLNPQSPTYSIFLPRATNNNNHAGDPDDYILGGSPYLLVEEGVADVGRFKTYFPLVFN